MSLARAEAMADCLTICSPHTHGIQKRDGELPSPAPDQPVWRIPEPEQFTAASVPGGLVGTTLDPAFEAIDAPFALRRRRRGKGVTVAVLDTGCDVNHPAFRGRAIKALDATGTNPSGRDANSHGTWCCGAIVGQIGDGTGSNFVGLAPDCTLISIQVLTAAGWGTDDMISRGIILAITAGADFCSLSLGGGGEMPKTLAALKLARTKGITIFAAAGNEGPNPNTVGFPGRYSEVVCVGSVGTSPPYKPSRFSSRGTALDLSAPGEQLWGPVLGGRLSPLTGTSMATPVVCGAYALLAGHDEERPQDGPRTLPAVSEAVIATSHTHPDDGGQQARGHGRIQVMKANDKLEAGVSPPPPPPPPLGTYVRVRRSLLRDLAGLAKLDMELFQGLADAPDGEEIER
jgi:major intracellular serine protease